jgi:hypothetical protein
MGRIPDHLAGETNWMIGFDVPKQIIQCLLLPIVMNVFGVLDRSGNAPVPEDLAGRIGFLDIKKRELTVHGITSSKNPWTTGARSRGPNVLFYVSGQRERGTCHSRQSFISG